MGGMHALSSKSEVGTVLSGKHRILKMARSSSSFSLAHAVYAFIPSSLALSEEFVLNHNPDEAQRAGDLAWLDRVNSEPSERQGHLPHLAWRQVPNTFRSDHR